VKRVDLLRAIDVYLADFDNPACYGADGESRFLEMEGILGSIDWGQVPVETARSVLRYLVRTVPLEYLTCGTRGEGGLAGALAVATRCNTACKLDEQQEAEHWQEAN
jgi:hypothetical protein